MHLLALLLPATVTFYLKTLLLLRMQGLSLLIGSQLAFLHPFLILDGLTLTVFYPASPFLCLYQGITNVLAISLASPSYALPSDLYNGHLPMKFC